MTGGWPRPPSVSNGSALRRHAEFWRVTRRLAAHAARVIVWSRAFGTALASGGLPGEAAVGHGRAWRAFAMAMPAYHPNVRAVGQARGDRLTGRQAECLRWAEVGRSARDIGAILGISQRTVEEHLAIACATLGVRTRVQAVVCARRLGLLD
jgi:DNA-binding CsgD family transcriptional regulator